MHKLEIKRKKNANKNQRSCSTKQQKRKKPTENQIKPDKEC